MVAKGRRAGDRVYGMRALAVDELLRGKGLATQMLGEMKKELAMVAGGRFRLVAALASCMDKGGAGFYARQGWTGGEGIWMWGGRAKEWTEWGEQQCGRRASRSLGRHPSGGGCRARNRGCWEWYGISRVRTGHQNV